jgi:hypothetical protein
MDADGETDALGLTDGLWLALGDTLADGDCEALGLTDGDTDALGETEADGLPAATPETLSISTNPQAVGLPVDRVKEADAVVPPLPNIWSAIVIPFPSTRSVQLAGAV